MATIPLVKGSFGFVLPTTYNGTSINPSYISAVGPDSIRVANGKRTFLVVINGDASTKTVTLTAQKGASDGHKNNVGPITVPAFVTPFSGVQIIGPLDDPNLLDTNNDVIVNYSAVTNVKVIAIELAEVGRP